MIFTGYDNSKKIDQNPPKPSKNLASLDRIVHDAHRVDLTGESLRKTRDRQKDIEIMN